jgi:hypothetical protein
MLYVQNTVRMFARFKEFAGTIEAKKANRGTRSLRDVWIGHACRSGNDRRQANEAAGQQEVAQDRAYGKEDLRLGHTSRHVDSIDRMRGCASTMFVCGSSVTMCICPIAISHQKENASSLHCHLNSLSPGPVIIAVCVSLCAAIVSVHEALQPQPCGPSAMVHFRETAE